MSSRMVPIADPILEADRILDAAALAGVVTRLLGGVAVSKHQHRETPAELVRSYGDIDLMVDDRGSRRLRDLLVELGYEANRPFNALHGERRLVFFDVENGRHLDVLVNTFEMCHKLEPLPLAGQPNTLAPTDLLLTKLQVVQVTEKDLTDSCTLILQHEVAEGEGDLIDLGRLQEVTRRDWGWYTTVGDNLTRLLEFAAGRLRSEAEVRSLEAKVLAVRAALDAAPKTLKWKARSSVGRRVPWYVLPEEPNKA